MKITPINNNNGNSPSFKADLKFSKEAVKALENYYGGYSKTKLRLMKRAEEVQFEKLTNFIASKINEIEKPFSKEGILDEVKKIIAGKIQTEKIVISTRTLLEKIKEDKIMLLALPTKEYVKNLLKTTQIYFQKITKDLDGEFIIELTPQVNKSNQSTKKIKKRKPKKDKRVQILPESLFNIKYTSRTTPIKGNKFSFELNEQLSTNDFFNDYPEAEVTTAIMLETERFFKNTLNIPPYIKAGFKKAFDKFMN